MAKKTNINLIRYSKNPILEPDPTHPWETQAAFNPNIVKQEGIYHLFYRALSAPIEKQGIKLNLSSIGYAQSADGRHFYQRRQLVKPQLEWEQYGCEDPRVTVMDDRFYIFYTAISAYPPSADSIKVGLAISDNLGDVSEKHLITPFNSKAMAMFPQKIQGKYAVILSVDTDRPPAKMVIALFNKINELWSPDFWHSWYQQHRRYSLPLTRLNNDLVEVGAPPLLTDAGWLLIYSHIQNYFDPKKRLFGIEAVLLDKDDPLTIVGRTTKPLLTPTEEYELKGQVNRITFPSGALKEKNTLYVCYGGADTVCAVASTNLTTLTYHLLSCPKKRAIKLTKHLHNPILRPNPDKNWQAQSVFNPAAIYLNQKVYLIYRALSPDNTSTLGCVTSADGFNFQPVSQDPIYVPRMPFEQKQKTNALSGCEDPRITRIDDRFYMLYTAFDGVKPPRVALSSIKVSHFMSKQWVWTKPVLISPDNIDDKNACIFPEKINGKYIIFHRLAGKEIAIDYTNDLHFNQKKVLQKEGVIHPRPDSWDSDKIGIAGPPHKTKFGWLLFYHGVSSFDQHYRLGFMMLDLSDPSKVIFRTPYPILEPTETWEKEGLVPNVVFSCGSVIINNQVFLYYGGADRVIGAATINLKDLLDYAG